MKNIAIQIESLSKIYRLGTIGYGTLRDDLRTWWRLRQGKEDPNSQIGEESRFSRTGEFSALNSINLTVEKGDRVGIIGRNGAGKSTLLKILARVTSPTAGKVSIRGQISSLLEVGTGFHPELTGRENVFLNGAILGMKRKEIQQKFSEIVEFSGVSQFIDTPVKRYSSGMYVRLAFSVAVHLDSDVLIVDEVLAVGDADFQKRCIKKMQEISVNEGKTLLFVSHNTASIASVCNSGVLLEEGKIKTIGDIQSVLSSYLIKSNELENLKGHPGKEGSHELEIVGIRLLSRGHSVTEIFCGDNLSIEFPYERYTQSLGTINFSVQFLDNYGNAVALIHNRMMTQTIMMANSRGVVKVEISHLNLNVGTYSITFAITTVENGIEKFVDRLDSVRKLTVLPGNYIRSGDYPPEGFGAVVFRSNWSEREDLL